jgi:hypothetical protein
MKILFKTKKLRARTPNLGGISTLGLGIKSWID